MPTYLTSNKLPEERGVYFSIRIRNIEGFPEEKTTLQKIVEKPKVDIIFIPSDLELTWSTWWTYTVRLIKQTWRTVYGRFTRKY